MDLHEIVMDVYATIITVFMLLLTILTLKTCPHKFDWKPDTRAIQARHIESELIMSACNMHY